MTATVPLVNKVLERKRNRKKIKGYFWQHEKRGYIRSICLRVRFGRGARFVFKHRVAEQGLI